MDGEQLSLSLFPENAENEGNYFQQKRNWSASKHRILLRYIQAHCYNLGGRHKLMNYVDGFSGSGKYQKGIGIEDFVGNSKFWANQYKNKTEFEDTDGSPLIALKCSKLFKQENRVELRCFFIEKNPRFNLELIKNCQLIGEDLQYKIYEPQKFEDAFPQLMQDIGNHPTLFFLDTFGVKGVTFQHICSISNYLKENKGELFILFHNIQVARHAGQSTAKAKNRKMQQAVINYTQNLTNLLGDNSDHDWKIKWQELQGQPQQFEKWALEYFKERLRKESDFKGVTSFEVKETYRDNRPQYSIVVGSNHPEKAFGQFINEFVYAENKLLFYQKEKDKHIQKFLEKEWNAEQSKKIKMIKPEIIKLLCKLYPEWISFDNAITQIILSLDEIGFLCRKQYYQILSDFYEENMLEIRNPGSRKPYTLNSELRILETRKFS
jgi:three-Cys-motif partner protein